MCGNTYSKCMLLPFSLETIELSREGGFIIGVRNDIDANSGASRNGSSALNVEIL